MQKIIIIVIIIFQSSFSLLSQNISKIKIGIFIDDTLLEQVLTKKISLIVFDTTNKKTIDTLICQYKNFNLEFNHNKDIKLTNKLLLILDMTDNINYIKDKIYLMNQKYFIDLFLNTIAHKREIRIYDNNLKKTFKRIKNKNKNYYIYTIINDHSSTTVILSPTGLSVPKK